MANNIQVRDAFGTAAIMKTLEVDGIHTPVHNIGGYDAQDDMVKVKSIQKKMRDSFTGLPTDKWDVVTSGGVTATTALGALTIASGTTAGGYAELLSKETFTIPFRAMFGVQSGPTRQANTHHLIEAVSVDPITGIPDGKHSIDVDIGGSASTTVTQMVYGVQNGGLRSLRSGVSTITTTATYSIIELEPFSDECYFHSRTMDTTAGRSGSFVRHQQIPDPTGVYKLRLRSMNHAVWNDTISGAIAGTAGVIRLTITAHGRTTGNVIWVEQLNGVTNNGGEVRGNFTVTVVDVNTLELNTTTFGGTYIAGSGRWALAAAPAASINLQFQFMNCQDYAELTAEITAGRGQIVEGQAIAARMVAGSVAAVTGTVALGAGTAIAGSVFNADNMYWNDSIVAQAAAATVTGAARDAGAAVGVAHRYSSFNAFAFADQPGTMWIECSNDNITWRRTTADTAVAANTPVFLKSPVMTRYYRVVYVNGATLQTAFMLNSSFTAS